MFIDLHTHSTYSDGTYPPEQLAAKAKAAGVSLVALADHNTFAGSARMRKACHGAGIGCIDAVEIDTMFRGEDLHILAYGCDMENEAFAAHVLHARAMLDKMTADLIDILNAQGKPVSREDLEAYPDQTGRGGWKGLFYLQERLGYETHYPVFPLYDANGVTYAQAGFRPAQETIARIHEAGGLAILAHPGDVSRLDGHVNAGEMAEQLEALFALGLDGAECHYPKHAAAETALFVEVCRRHGKIITSGSDCHGAFSGKPVGFMKKTEVDLCLGALLEKVHR